jgi:hypothetical protein
LRIKEFFISRYGPLQYPKPVVLRPFTLFFGKNEDGKTLTIDGLVKLLLGGKIKHFKNIERVDEAPEGYVLIDLQNGEEFKIPESGDLTKIADLTPSECSNLFIIRNSDLCIPDEGEFYTQITDRLTGLRMEEI